MKEPGFAPLGYFVLRTPLLPFAMVDVAWAASDDELRALALGGPLAEALALASPSLLSALRRAGPDREPTVTALRRYVARAAGRATPFGLLAGVSTGTTGEATRLLVPRIAECRKNVRVDSNVADQIATRVSAEPEVRSRCRFQTNDSLRCRGDDYEYVRAQIVEGVRRLTTSRFPSNVVLDAIVELTKDGLALADLREALEARRLPASTEEVAELLESLIDAGVLLPETHPSLLDRDSLAKVVAWSPAVREAAERIAAYVAAPIGGACGSVAAVNRSVGSALGSEVHNALHVDLHKPSAQLSVGPRVVRELAEAARLIASWRIPSTRSPLADFAARFTSRFGEREIPLLDAIDEDRGVGFEGGQARATVPSSLIDGVFGEGSRADDPSWMLARTHAPRSLEWELTAEDVARLQSTEARALPGSFGVLATMAAGSWAAADRGEFQVRVHGVGSSPGTQLVARFAHGDPVLHRHLRDHCDREAAREPNVIFAEVYHSPGGRLGNVLTRPSLRRHHIRFGDGFREPHEGDIELADLAVSVTAGEVRLRSRSTGREVRPRLSSAHAHWRAESPIYRFLCSLQEEGWVAPAFPWGDLEEMPFRPRVRHGRIIFDVATWKLSRAQCAALANAPAEFLAEARHRLLLPSHVVLVEHDHVLPLRIDEPACQQELARQARGRASLTLREQWPPAEALCASGSEGTFVHEMVVPFVRTDRVSSKPSSRAVPSPAAATSVVARRVFLPGSEWLYFRLYASTLAADDFVRRELPRVQLVARELKVAWHFLRYQDEQGHHLRIRFHGDPAETLPRLSKIVAARAEEWVARGDIRSLEVASYERELERYGGYGWIDKVEEAFAIDSAAVLGALAWEKEHELDTSERWELALMGMHSILEHVGVPVRERVDLLDASHRSYQREFSNTAWMGRVSSRARSLKMAAAEVLQMAAPVSKCIIEAHSGLGGKLPWSELHEERRNEIIAALLHLHVVRMMQSDARRHELLLTRMLRDFYRTQVATGATSKGLRKSH